MKLKFSRHKVDFCSKIGSDHLYGNVFTWRNFTLQCYYVQLAEDPHASGISVIVCWSFATDHHNNH